MVLIFELNTVLFVPVTLHGTSNVIPHWVWILFVVVSLHQWSANFFLSRPDHLFNCYWRPTTLETTRTKRVHVCSCSDTGNMQLPYNSPGGYLVHVLFFQIVFFQINGPRRTSGNPGTTVFWKSEHTKHDVRESPRENFISCHTKYKVTSHSNRNEKSGIIDEKRKSLDEEKRLTTTFAKPTADVKSRLVREHDMLFLNSVQTDRQMVMGYYDIKLRKKVNRKVEK